MKKLSILFILIAFSGLFAYVNDSVASKIIKNYIKRQAMAVAWCKVTESQKKTMFQAALRDHKKSLFQFNRWKKKNAADYKKYTNKWYEKYCADPCTIDGVPCNELL